MTSLEGNPPVRPTSFFWQKKRMALGSKTTFKSYVKAPIEDSLITFDDNDLKNQDVTRSSTGQMEKLKSSDELSTSVLGGKDHDNGPDLLNLSDSSPTERENVGSDVDEVQPVDIMSTSEIQDSSRLCGYLNKYKVGARGLGRNFKKRWFVFVDSSCKLLYFRTPQDIVPLGEIDVSNASFNIEASHDEGGYGSGRDHIFEIRWVDFKCVALLRSTLNGLYSGSASRVL